MATTFKEIYPLFLAQIDDYEFGSILKEELEFIMQGYLINSLLTIQETLTDVYDIDIENKQFNVDLEFAEKLLIAKAMKLEWIREKKYSEELMRKDIGDRDYKSVQGTEYLESLTMVEKELKREIRNELMKHAYSSRDKFGGLLNG